MMMKLDFLCVGFAKCGTGTLDTILRQYKQINLPLVKEPRFFHWKHRFNNPLDKLYNEYFANVKEEQHVGIVDPSMTRVSIDELDSCFGDETKIIVMLRNPVKALFSDFKMGMRAGYYWGYFKFFGKNEVNDRFEVFLNHCLNKQHDYKKLDLYAYDDYLDKLFEKRKKEDIMVIIFEEFIKNPKALKEEIENFLGIESEDVEYNIWFNKGDKICRNYLCARLVNFGLKIKNSADIRVKKFGIKFLDILTKFTWVENREKITPELQKKCEDIYRDSKNKVSQIIGKDLNKIWFE